MRICITYADVRLPQIPFRSIAGHQNYVIRLLTEIIWTKYIHLSSQKITVQSKRTCKWTVGINIAIQHNIGITFEKDVFHAEYRHGTDASCQQYIQPLCHSLIQICIWSGDKSVHIHLIGEGVTIKACHIDITTALYAKSCTHHVADIAPVYSLQSFFSYDAFLSLKCWIYRILYGFSRGCIRPRIQYPIDNCKCCIHPTNNVADITGSNRVQHRRNHLIGNFGHRNSVSDDIGAIWYIRNFLSFPLDILEYGISPKQTKYTESQTSKTRKNAIYII